MHRGWRRSTKSDLCNIYGLVKYDTYLNLNPGYESLWICFAVRCEITELLKSTRHHWTYQTFKIDMTSPYVELIFILIAYSSTFSLIKWCIKYSPFFPYMWQVTEFLCQKYATFQWLSTIKEKQNLIKYSWPALQIWGAVMAERIRLLDSHAWGSRFKSASCVNCAPSARHFTLIA